MDAFRGVAEEVVAAAGGVDGVVCIIGTGGIEAMDVADVANDIDRVRLCRDVGPGAGEAFAAATVSNCLTSDETLAAEEDVDAEAIDDDVDDNTAAAVFALTDDAGGGEAGTTTAVLVSDE